MPSHLSSESSLCVPKGNLTSGKFCLSPNWSPLKHLWYFELKLSYTSHIILCIILFCTSIPRLYKFKSCSWAVSGVLQLSVSCLAFCCGAGKLKNICRQGQSSLLFFREYLQSFIRLRPIPTPILDAMSTDLSPEPLTSIACITI